MVLTRLFTFFSFAFFLFFRFISFSFYNLLRIHSGTFFSTIDERKQMLLPIDIACQLNLCRSIWMWKAMKWDYSKDVFWSRCKVKACRTQWMALKYSWEILTTKLSLSLANIKHSELIWKGERICDRCKEEMKMKIDFENPIPKFNININEQKPSHVLHNISRCCFGFHVIGLNDRFGRRRLNCLWFWIYSIEIFISLSCIFSSFHIFH